MNEDYVHKWNITVDNNDDVYVLGDLMLGDKSNIEFIKRLKGRIHIVLGNHDTPTREAMYKELPNVVEVAWAIKLDYRKYHFYMSHFPTLTGNLEKEHLHQMTLNLYGHTHQNTNFYEDRPYCFHVGVDSHDGYPILLDTVIIQMKNKVDECKSFLGNEESAEQAIPIDQSRCGKCFYEILACGENDFYGNCPKYKRDPPNGGFYG